MTPFEQSRAAYKVLASYWDLPLQERKALGTTRNAELAEAQAIIDANRPIIRGTIESAVKDAPMASITTIKF